MKTIVLAGPGEVAKRQQALRIKQKYQTELVTTIDLAEKSQADLKIQLSSPSLLAAGPRLVMVEHAPDDLDLVQFAQSDPNLTLVLLAANPKVDSNLLVSAKKIGAAVYQFEGEKEISAFPFVDALLEKRKEALVEFDRLFAAYGGMYVLAMIYYGLRRNILPLPVSVFLREKILRQKKQYSMADWEKMYRLVLKTDFQIKEGIVTDKTALTVLIEKIIGLNF